MLSSFENQLKSINKFKENLKIVIRLTQIYYRCLIKPFGCRSFVSFSRGKQQNTKSPCEKLKEVYLGHIKNS